MFFDADEIPEDENSFDLIPSGTYLVCVQEAKEITTKSGSGVQVKFQIVDEKYNGRNIFNIYNIKNESEKAETIGRRQFANLLLAIDKRQLNDPAEIVDSVLKIQFKSKKEGEYDRYNISKYIPTSGEKPVIKKKEKAPEQQVEELNDDDLPF